ncbi:MAG TPA: RNA methyltransferase [Moraxellaceae bacterium]|nr:RNA methyltransferase [Moraxellaceae bacterium]
MEIIRSRQNPLVRHLVKLAESRRDRQKSRQTLLVGTHLVEAAIAASWTLDRLLTCEGHDDHPDIRALISAAPCPVTRLSAELFREIEQAPSTTGLMALISLPAQPLPVKKGCCLLLEGIQDPGNVGSIFRTAVAAGVDQIWLTAGCADIWSPKVLRAGMGAHFLIPLIDRVTLTDVLPGFTGPIVVTTLDRAVSLYDTSLPADMVLAMGSEGQGVSEELLSLASQRIHIPMAGPVESLNVAAATAICLFERRRQELSSAGSHQKPRPPR